ncbi:MAG: TauD/TfdA family dioxygenase [Actinobacteria bacterium]|nr:TauD/TfdA family dioxygenase [Actinomycetota bacterium]
MPDIDAGEPGRTGRRVQGGPAAWRPADLTSDDWTVVLDDGQRNAIVAAVEQVQRDGVTLDELAAAPRSAFPLGDLEPQVAAWSDALASGRGFLLLRRFPIDLLDDPQVELAYMGLGLHLGGPVSQNANGDLLTHVRDERLLAGVKARLYRTRERQDFHTDGADIIGLLCLHRARSGGESRIVSSFALHDEILRRRPDLLEELYAPMCWDRQGEEAPGEQPWFRLAPLHDIDGVPRLFYIGWYIRDAQRHADVPRLTTAQLEAMELLESLTNDPSFHLEMAFEPGDVQLLNNGRILHAREAYEDDDDPAERRHLLRLWLAAHRFASLENGLRGGIETPT